MQQSSIPRELNPSGTIADVADTSTRATAVAFGKRLRIARQQRALSGTELANRLGLERSAIPQYETGRSFPSIPVLLKMVRILGVTLDSLLFDEYEAKEQIEDKELAAYITKADRLPHRERSVIKDFIDGLLARVELEELKRATRKPKKAA